MPKEWSIGRIIPVYKNKGDKNDPGNYRGISILSCFRKFFTTVLNNRLSFCLEENHLLSENKAGFRKAYSTVDHIFTLKGIIDLFFSIKKKTVLRVYRLSKSIRPSVEEWVVVQTVKNWHFRTFLECHPQYV